MKGGEEDSRPEDHHVQWTGGKTEGFSVESNMIRCKFLKSSGCRIENELE